MIAIVAFRAVQIIFGAVVLGLTASLAKERKFTQSAATNYASFTGGFGMIIGGIGIVACFVEALAGLIMMGLDLLASLFFVAGGIAIAILLRDVSCSSKAYDNITNLSRNGLVNGGCKDFGGDFGVRCNYENDDDLFRRCKMQQAGDVFMFFTFVVSGVLVYFSFREMKKGKGVRSDIV